MADERRKIDVGDSHVQEAIRAEVQRQLRVIEGERAVAQYFQNQLQGIVYSSFVRLVFKLDEFLKGTRDVLNVGLWYLTVICFGVVSSVYIQTHFLNDPAYARYKTAIGAVGVILQYIVQVYFMFLVSLITGTIDMAARDINWVTLEISTVAVCLSISIMLSSAFFKLVRAPGADRRRPEHQDELMNEMIDEMMGDG